MQRKEKIEYRRQKIGEWKSSGGGTTTLSNDREHGKVVGGTTTLPNDTVYRNMKKY